MNKPVNAVSASQIVIALHFRKPRHRAPESFGAVAGGIKLIRRQGGRADQLYSFVIQSVDQQSKPPRLVALVLAHGRNAVDQNRVEFLRQGKVIGRRQWLFAKLVE